MRILSALLVSFLLFFFSSSSWNPVHGAERTNKFRERKTSDRTLGYPKLDEDSLLNTTCPRHVELRWKTGVSSSIFATPLIADINSDGKLEVVVSSFVHYLEVLEGLMEINYQDGLTFTNRFLIPPLSYMILIKIVEER